MRQLFLDKGNLVVKEVAQPLLHDHCVLVSVHHAYISGNTNTIKINAQESFISNIPHKVKRVLESVALYAVESASPNDLSSLHLASGYSCAGHVVSVGKKVTKFTPGDFVACVDPGHSPHTDLVCVPEYCAVKVSDKNFLKAASLTSLAAYALYGIRRAQLQIGERVCIFGLSVIGLLAVQLAKIAGCFVIGIDMQQARAELAVEFGADVVFHVFSDEIEKEVDLITEHHGVDTTFITSLDDDVFQRAVRVTRKKGKVVLLGVGMPAVSHRSYLKDVDILVATDLVGDRQRVTCPYAYARWTDNRNMQTCLQLIEQGKLKLDSLIKEEITTKNIKPVYQKIQNNLTIGAVLTYDQRISSQSLRVATNYTKKVRETCAQGVRFIPAVTDILRVGVIGAGDFLQRSLIPLVGKLRGASISAIVDTDIRKSMAIEKRYGTAKICTKEELLTSDLIDVVFIASSDVLHAEHALQALRCGKAVFLEKPMVTDFGQLERLYSFLRTQKNVPFCTSYSYSFSPFAQKIKKVVQKRRTPLMINYRSNHEFLRNECRMQAEVDAGRIIGDACQIIDLFCYLVDSEPISVSVEAMHSARDDIFPTDNVSVQISFHDGSVCSLVYTTLGNVGMGTDRMEIFYDRKAILMEEYTELYGFGLSSKFNETITMPDNGYEALVTNFFHALQKNQYVPPIDPERLYTVAYISLLIDQLACEGGGKKELR